MLFFRNERMMTREHCSPKVFRVLGRRRKKGLWLNQVRRTVVQVRIYNLRLKKQSKKTTGSKSQRFSNTHHRNQFLLKIKNQ